ncbi:hypothetical protein [Alicyclobacillus acidocaldarius]|uniref:hypothetical protein n=1 Tax=Alicyclobacillus acidocaldarius TaxID=405212 RepID=UPI0005A2FC20|nr:hypothetical protein [Alicyclobacillus acidocaldarius]
MSVTDVDSLLARLESLVDQVLDGLIRGETAELLPLMSAQCECLQKLDGVSLEAHGERLRLIAERAMLQQQLIQQGLGLSQAFLGRIYQRNGFLSWA